MELPEEVAKRLIVLLKSIQTEQVKIGSDYYIPVLDIYIEFSDLVEHLSLHYGFEVDMRLM